MSGVKLVDLGLRVLDRPLVSGELALSLMDPLREAQGGLGDLPKLLAEHGRVEARREL